MALAIFVAHMDVLLERFLEVCKEGYHDHGLWLPVLAFADNIWLFVRTPNELEQMFRAWIAVMRGKWSVHKTNECTWSHRQCIEHEFPDQVVTDETEEK